MRLSRSGAALIVLHLLPASGWQVGPSRLCGINPQCALPLTLGKQGPRCGSRRAPTPFLAERDPFSDWQPPPGLEPDATVLIWYYGWSTVFRSAAYRFQVSGLPFKRLDELGFDMPALSQALGGASALAATWVLAGLLTGVLERDDSRYDPARLLLTWMLAAPTAQALKYAAGWNAGDGSFKSGDALTDIVMTLALMYGVRVLERQGYL